MRTDLRKAGDQIDKLSCVPSKGKEFSGHSETHHNADGNRVPYLRSNALNKPSHTIKK